MKRSVLMVMLIAMLSAIALAQTARRPSFNAYPAKVEAKRANAINFRQSHDARTFRTRLTEALRGSVNFAGHYIIAGWGCGTGCISGAIIDTRNGYVYWPEQLNALSTGTAADGNYVKEPVAYRKNSRLLVITGSPGKAKDDDPDLPSGEYYYEWKANRLRPVKFVAKEEN